MPQQFISLALSFFLVLYSLPLESATYIGESNPEKAKALADSLFHAGNSPKKKSGGARPLAISDAFGQYPDGDPRAIPTPSGAPVKPSNTSKEESGYCHPCNKDCYNVDACHAYWAEKRAREEERRQRWKAQQESYEVCGFWTNLFGSKSPRECALEKAQNEGIYDERYLSQQEIQAIKERRERWARESAQEEQKRQQAYNELSPIGKIGYWPAIALTIAAFTGGFAAMGYLGALATGVANAGNAAWVSGFLGFLFGNIPAIYLYDNPDSFHEAMGTALAAPFALSYGVLSGLIRIGTLGFINPPSWGSPYSKRGSKAIYKLYRVANLATQTTALLGGAALGLGAIGVPVLAGAAALMGTPVAAAAGIYTGSSALVQGGRWLIDYNKEFRSLQKENQQLAQEVKVLEQELKDLDPATYHKNPPHFPKGFFKSTITYNNKLKSYYEPRTEKLRGKITDIWISRAQQAYANLSPERLPDVQKELNSANDILKKYKGDRFVMALAAQHLSYDETKIATEGVLKLDEQGQWTVVPYSPSELKTDFKNFQNYPNSAPAEGKLTSVAHEIRELSNGRGPCSDSEGCLKIHGGEDWAGAFGSIAQATKNGKVVFVGEIGEYGHSVVMETDLTSYDLDYREFGFKAHFGAHQTSGIIVKEGEVLKQGEIIGLMGNSGKAQGPHVHQELFRIPKGDPAFKIIDKALSQMEEVRKRYGETEFDKWPERDKNKYKGWREDIATKLFGWDFKPLATDPKTGKKIYAKKFSATASQLKKQKERLEKKD